MANYVLKPVFSTILVMILIDILLMIVWRCKNQFIYYKIWVFL